MKSHQFLPDEIRRIEKLWADGLDRKQIAERMNCSYGCIWKQVKKIEEEKEKRRELELYGRPVRFYSIEEVAREAA